MNYTKHSLKKTEELFEEIGYTIRYEKGHFQSGYCLVENNKIAVINKFFDTEGRINSLIDILVVLDIDESNLSPKMLQWYKKLRAVNTDEGAIS